MAMLPPGAAIWAEGAVLALWALAICRTASLAEDSVRARSASPSGRAVPYVLAFAIAFVAVLARPIGEALVVGVATIALVAAAPGDLRTGLLFDAVTFPAVVAVIGLAFALDRGGPALAGVAFVAGFFAALVLFSRGRWMGLGDVKALFAISAAFGPIESVLAVFIACLSGIAFAAVRPSSLDGRALPFGPHLAAGACAVLVAGPFVERAWMHVS